MIDTLHIKANLEFLPPIISEEASLKLWQRLEHNPCKSEDEQALYEALTKRFITLASFGLITTQKANSDQP